MNKITQSEGLSEAFTDVAGFALNHNSLEFLQHYAVKVLK